MHPVAGEAPKTGSGKPWLPISIAVIAGMGVLFFARRKAA